MTERIQNIDFEFKPEFLSAAICQIGIEPRPIGDHLRTIFKIFGKSRNNNLLLQISDSSTVQLREIFSLSSRYLDLGKGCKKIGIVVSPVEDNPRELVVAVGLDCGLYVKTYGNLAAAKSWLSNAKSKTPSFDGAI